MKLASRVGQACPMALKTLKTLMTAFLLTKKFKEAMCTITGDLVPTSLRRTVKVQGLSVIAHPDILPKFRSCPLVLSPLRLHLRLLQLVIETVMVRRDLVGKCNNHKAMITDKLIKNPCNHI